MHKKNSPTPNEIIEITIDSLSYNGGRGVGRHEGIVVFVPGTAPRDRVRVRVTSKKAKFWEAELVELTEPSPLRREPPCPVADRCGGCSWQHITYAIQVEEKKKILAASLRPLAKIATWEWLPFVEAPEEFNYRNRVQVQLQNGKKGFFAKRSHALVVIDTCLIAEEGVNRQLKELKAEPGVTRMELRVDGETDFSQVNGKQNLRLREMVLARSVAAEWIMDLYCGSGNFTLPLAQKFPTAKILAADLSRASIEIARAKSPRIEWIADDVAKVLEKIDKKSGSGLIVLDPPRAGCEAAVTREILRLQPKQIVYVSCNPTTFSRDAVRLLESGEYKLVSIQGLDMFPQTEHVESVALFVRA